MATNGNSNHDQYAAQAQTTEAPASAESSANNLPKDEVGWYFVEQYYTTMSKSPERLHLFYGKKAQFVCGREAEVVNVAFGRQAIQERIRGMDFQDCKVRISNVDTQGSGDNILITVIGEMANKDGEPKKFVQTFVLAQQPSGYFVLNDMLRFLNEDVEEEEAEAPAEEPAQVETATATEAQPAQEASAGAGAAVAAAAEPAPEKPAEPEAEKKEEPVAEPAAVAAETTPAPEPAAAAEAPTAAAVEEKQAPADVDKTVEAIAEEDVSKPEEPKDPAPTPAVAEPAPAAEPAAAPAPAQPEKPKEPEVPKGPPKPMTWASRLAAGVPKPAVPVPAAKPATPPAAAQPRAPAPAASATAAAAAPAPRAPAPAQAQEAASPASASKDQGSEWQTAETKRQSRGPHSAAAQSDKDSTMAYIKLANPAKIDDAKLKEHLTAFGPLVYFDVNREKGCAFIEFKTPAGYAAAVAANPHTLDGQEFLVTARRPKPSAYGGSNYGATRGGAGRGRGGGYEPTRSGSQGGRGGLGQARGRGGGPRGGRGASQAGTGAA
ncbi:hypothetical protein VTJ83DRAFT_2477 [Remersonia thermophila]|uniref:Uncharacterized protein n=1 Tax=Remersonia thermophila TaxID=72144 RepID=A0ABR4DIU7_9PEZI